MADKLEWLAPVWKNSRVSFLAGTVFSVGDFVGDLAGLFLYIWQMKTWHLELAVVSAILCTITFLFANDLVNWVTTLAILVTFNHGIIGDRLQEKQGKMDRPTVECYWKLNRLFAAKEILWTTAFLIMQNYAAIVGSVLFFLYPFWRKYYRHHIKPLN